jgi:hypothetical protein
MKKFVTLFLLIAFTAASGSVLACPKGTHPHGGTGSHHKGGSCY